MQFNTAESRRRRQRRSHISVSSLHRELYPHSLQFYTTPPQDTITLEEFEGFAIRRVQLLRLVETIGLKHNKNSKEYTQAMYAAFKKNDFHGYLRLNLEPHEMTDIVYEERRQDHISHFILRLVYCRSEELRRWFIAQELDLFRFRFIREPMNRVKQFLTITKMDYKPISFEEKREVANQLVNSTFSLSMYKAEEMDFYKVAFTAVPDLVRGRKVYLHRGMAYVPYTDLVSVVLNKFRGLLSHSLTTTSKILPALRDDTRLTSLLAGLNATYIGEDYTSKSSSGAVHPGNLDQLCKTSFPLCMSTIHDYLRTNHHLRHQGRMQYGLFLKGIGLSLEDALKFWRAEFTKVMDTEKFEKGYSYNIRHNYGKEGKRANYTPYSCSKVILTNKPGAGDCHGCPFVHYDERSLVQELKKLQISQDAIHEIVRLKSENHFQVACGKYFETKHPGAILDQPIAHPNQYFELSQKQLGGTLLGGSKSKVTTTRVNVYESQKPSNDDDLDTMMDDITEQDMEAIMQL